MRKTSANLIVAGFVSLGFALPAAAEETTDIGTLDGAKAERAFSSKPVYSPYAGRNFPTWPLFGDTHLHTGASFDAGAFGDLANAPEGKAPTFLVAALRDPIGANLDRYQIVKGWLDDKGETHEKVYDVAWGGDRQPGPDGKVPAVGSTVDVANATWTNTIGAPELIAVWTDPAFDPAQKAFYYGRVIEIPTPRWTAYDTRRFGNKPVEGTRMTVTERAYTSPIWYTPG